MHNTIPLAYVISDAVKVSGITRTRLYSLIGNGSIRAVKAGKRTLIPADSLQSYLDNLPQATIGKQGVN